MTLWSTYEHIIAGSVFLLLVLLFQLWVYHRPDKMEILIENGVLYLDNRRFSLVGAGNGCADFKYGRWPLEVRFNETHRCEMVYGDGFGWIGGHPDCDAVLGNVRGRHAVLADILAQERLRIIVLDALDDGKRVMLEVIN